MKSVLFSFILLLSSCTTTNFLRYEEGEVVSLKNNVRQTKEPSKFSVSMEKIADGNSKFLAVKINRNEPIKEEWEDIYSKVGIYETRCRGWRDFPEPHEYCKFDFQTFTLSHLLLLGFLYDIAIPFQPYNERVIESKENVIGTISKTDHRIIDSESPIKAIPVKLTINGISANSTTAQGIGKFNFSKLKLDPDNVPSYAQVQIEFDDQKIDLASEYSKFADTERARKIAQEAYENRPDVKYKIPYCAQRELLYSINNPRGTVESNCIYHITGYPLKVLQVTPQGILVILDDQYSLGKVFLIKTNKKYVDDDRVEDMLVKSIGTVSYTSVMGGMKTIHSFQHLGK